MNKSLEIPKVKAFSLFHCFPKHPARLPLILQSAVPFALAQHIDAWRASGFVHSLLFAFRVLFHQLGSLLYGLQIGFFHG